MKFARLVDAAPSVRLHEILSRQHSYIISGKRQMSYSKLTNIPHKLPKDLQKQQLLDFPAYKSWILNLEKSLDLQRQPDHPFHDDPYQLRGIEVQCCDYFGGERLGFIKFKADIVNGQGEKLPGSVFMRGGSVAMLILLRSGESEASSSSDEYVILAIQPRVAGASLGFAELPAGMIDRSGTFSGAAAKEIREETGLDIKEEELIDMTELALASRTDEDRDGDEFHLHKAVYPSPGGSDEFIPIFLARKTMEAHEIEELKGKLTGLRDRGEMITLKICKLRDLWKVGARDGKTLAAVALYEGLKREGKI